ncbi:MAG: DNA polymerase I [Deltaproteobacteria bacterium HGW-Deltaproteobacteria-15]|nr:MAG: DNA polymerase I [Deltaproteobacteria bacterium HGW-Deltaproteobacteria-15]
MTRGQKTIYLVDGSSYIYRAFHAIRNLSNSKGLPTNAVYGFARMILKLMEDKSPVFAAIVFDAEGPTFRHEMFKEYKATRSGMPEDLVVQIPFIHRLVQGLSLPMVERQGYEADDVIGTLSRVAEEKGYDVFIVTGDKDFRQLLSPRTTLWDPMKDRLTSYEGFVKECGFEPDRIIDIMGLSGDSIDNIPGVPGVGEKTATELVKRFGTLENVFEHLEEIQKKKLKENLEKSRAAALLSKELVTIDRFVDLDCDLEELKIGTVRHSELSDLFRELEFKGLWDQFTIREEEGLEEYIPCLSEEELLNHVHKMREKGTVALNTQTSGDDPFRSDLVGISFSSEKKKGAYLPLAHTCPDMPDHVGQERALEMLKPVLEDEAIAKIGQNLKFQAIALKNHGIDLAGLRFDTMIASYVINPGLKQHDLNFLAQHYLNLRKTTYEEVAGKGKGRKCFSDVDLQQASKYSCEDADVALRLMEVLEKRLKEDGNEDLFYNVEMALIPVLLDMEATGIKIDKGFFREMSETFSRELDQIEKEIYLEAGTEFNINSPQQLGSVLFDKLQLPILKRTSKTKAHSTDVKVLTKLAALELPFKIPRLLLRYRTLSKLKATYLDSLVNLADPVTERIHTSFNQTVAATGRLSSSNPNLQNIPVRGEEGREIRKGFVAEDGWSLLSADYSQVELRIFAHYSGDDAFIEAFRAQEDIHTRTAAEIMGLSRDEVTPDRRRIAKAINFGIIYGMGPHKLSEELGIDHETAKNYISAYYDRYQGVARYREEVIGAAREKGYVTTLFNRRRYLPDINHKNHVIRSEAERMAINTPIQGTAADLIKMAMIRIHNRLKRDGFRSRMLLQVHDELVFEVPENELDTVPRAIRSEMEGGFQLRAPLKVDIKVGRNWDEAH